MPDAAQVALRAAELRVLLLSLPWRRAMAAHLDVYDEPEVLPDPFGEGLALMAVWPRFDGMLLAVPRRGVWDLVGAETLSEIDAESMRTNAGALVEALWPRREGRAA